MPHRAPELQREAVYGLTELARDEVAAARLVANPGCYPTSAQLPLVPLLEAGAIEADDIIIDAKSGVTGAGRAVKEAMLFAEVGEGIHAYSVARHRHAPEIEQGLTAAANRPVTVAFTPHLMPMNRGILATIYVRLAGGRRRRGAARHPRRALRGRAVRAPARRGRRAGDAPRPRLERVRDRRVRRPRAGPGDRAVGDRQPDQGRRGPGGAEHEPDVRLRRDGRSAAGGDVSLKAATGGTLLAGRDLARAHEYRSVD